MKKKLLSAFIASFLAFGFYAQQFNQITDINQNQNSNFYLNDFTALNDKLIFTHSQLYNGYPPKGLYTSDGTIGGTFQFYNWPQNLLIIKNDYVTGYYDSFVKMSNNLYFKVKVNQNPYLFQVWKTDGTSSGTQSFFNLGEKEFCSNLCEMNNQLFFVTKSFDPVWGNITHELWKSDGTTSGTIAVKNWVNSTSFSNDFRIISFNNKIYFQGFESDGSSIGTIQTGINLPAENESCLYNGLLYYKGTDGKIWKTDGSVSGTMQAVDFPISDKLFVFNGLMYFAGGYIGAGQTGYELFRTDGTLANTILIKDIYLGFNSSIPNKFIISNGMLHFWANDGIYGNELWKTDGTVTGTSIIKDISVGNDSYIRTQIVHNNQLFFHNYHNGIWKTDGTDINTVLVQSIDTTGVMIDINCKLFVSFDTMRFDQFGNYQNNSELWSLIDSCSSVSLTQKEEFNSLSIYPNPASNSITIKGETNMNQPFSIFDQMGREVFKGKLTGTETEVNLSSLSKGIYTLKIEGNYQPAQIVKE